MKTVRSNQTILMLWRKIYHSGFKYLEWNTERGSKTITAEQNYSHQR